MGIAASDFGSSFFQAMSGGDDDACTYQFVGSVAVGDRCRLLEDGRRLRSRRDREKAGF
jgi:hypothetical protein